MPIFLSREQVYRLLQRELPEGVYPDGPPERYYSTAESDSVAHVVANAYANLERIYANYWPQTADEKLGDWETMAFGKNQESGLGLAERRDRVMTALRSKKGLRKKDMKDVVHSIIGSDKVVDIYSWNCGEHGPWRLGVSALGVDTRLGAAPVLKATGSGLCGADPADYNATPLEWALMRQQAYTYEVVIRGYVPTEAEDAAIHIALTEKEPARSTHITTLGPILGTGPDDGGGNDPIYFGFEGDDDALGFGDLNNAAVGGVFADLNG